MTADAIYDLIWARLGPFVRELLDGNQAELESEFDGLVSAAAQEIAGKAKAGSVPDATGMDWMPR